MALLAGCLATGLLATGRECAAASPAPRPADAGTTWVAASTEPIQSPFVAWQSLPRTVSLDPLSANEVVRIKIDAYRSNGACMQWLFLKTGGKLRPIGAALGNGQGVVKLNGALRLGVFGAQSVVLLQFDPDMSLARMNAAVKASPIDGVGLYFGSRQSVKVVARSKACTLMKARCRRYESGTLLAEWSALKPSGVERIDVSVASAMSGDTRFVTEDMCPMTHAALHEQTWKSRLWGPMPGVLLNGIWPNASLKEALADVAAAAGSGESR